jgi:hypothetical protein
MKKKIWANPEVKILDIKRDTKTENSISCWPPHKSGK